MQPALPFEFVVRGTALSLQATNRLAIADWRSRIASAAREAMRGAWLLTDALAITIYLFPGDQLPGDIDNRIKPILDAMIRCVYKDDDQFERIVIQKFEVGKIFPFGNPSYVLLSAIEADEPVVYIRITDDLHEDLS